MKVLQINSVAGDGSTGRIVRGIQQTAEGYGVECGVLYGRESKNSLDSDLKISLGLDVYIHVFMTRIFDMHGLGSKKATKSVVEKIKKINPDIIHLHNIHGYYIHIALLFECLREIRKPVVWTLHDCWAFTGHCSYYDFIGCKKWQDFCYDCELKQEYPKSFLFDRSTKNYQLKKEIFSGFNDLILVTPSKWLMNQLKNSYLAEYPVKVINNGIDLDIFNPVSSAIRTLYNIKGDFLILGVAAIWDERKGLKYFIELSRRLRQDEKIILVGLSAKQIKQLPDGIIGIQRTYSASELAEIYSAADVFVNPTLEDNYPTTNLEAIACGTPVITFNSGGSAESVKDGCGLVVERGDLEGLINAISVIKNNKKCFYAENCRRYAISFFNKDERFKEYVEIYKSCVDR